MLSKKRKLRVLVGIARGGGGGGGGVCFEKEGIDLIHILLDYDRNNSRVIRSLLFIVLPRDL